MNKKYSINDFWKFKKIDCSRCYKWIGKNNICPFCESQGYFLVPIPVYSYLKRIKKHNEKIYFKKKKQI